MLFGVGLAALVLEFNTTSLHTFPQADTASETATMVTM